VDVNHSDLETRPTQVFQGKAFEQSGSGAGSGIGDLGTAFAHTSHQEV
jgi:hypothetical protein